MEDLGDPVLTTRATLEVARYTDIRLGLDVDARDAPLAREIEDPIACAAYLNLLANNLIVAGRYDDAISVTSIQESNANSLHLSFVRGHVATNRAASFIGLRRFEEAQAALEAIYDDDLPPWLEENARLVSARLALGRNDLDTAGRLMSSQPSSEIAAGLRGEYLALAVTRPCATGQARGSRPGRGGGRSDNALRGCRGVGPACTRDSCSHAKRARTRRAESTTRISQFRRRRCSGYGISSTSDITQGACR